MSWVRCGVSLVRRAASTRCGLQASRCGAGTARGGTGVLGAAVRWATRVAGRVELRDGWRFGTGGGSGRVEV
ncbi:hypothetical protein, partial [Planobispora rosea]|uniref:hypothetical protein n=1 Tax=Planobispora rosea TaxID=35762 RepID=UPI001C400D2A